MAQAQLEIVTKVKDEATSKMKELGRETDQVSTKANALGQAFSTALDALAAYAGAKGLQAVINATTESRMTLGQARFFLAGYKGDLEQNYQALVKWGALQQEQLGVGDEYATLVAAKLLPRVKNLQKAQEYGNILLRGQRIGMLNASESANMLIRATEGNERALRFLVEQLGISVPEFASLQTIFEELERRIKGAEAVLPPFATAWARMKETIGDFLETGDNFVNGFLAKVIEGFTTLFKQVPQIGNAFAILAGTLALFAAGSAIGGFFNAVLPAAMASSAGAVGLLVVALGALLAIGLYVTQILTERGATFSQAWSAVGLGILAVLGLIAAAVGGPITAFIALAAIIIAAGIAVWQNWDVVKEKLIGISQAIVDALKSIWGGFKDFWKGLWDGFVGIVQSAYDSVIGLLDRIGSRISSIVDSAKSIGSKISGAVGSVTSVISGRRASGGSVGAGQPYLVGENGPEIFYPAANGMIAAGAGAGGSQILIDMRGSSFLDRQVAVEIGDQIIRRLREMHRIGL